MLGYKRTVPLWRHRRRRLLVLERALAPSRGERTNKPSLSAEAAVTVKAANRTEAEARWQAWLRGN